MENVYNTYTNINNEIINGGNITCPFITNDNYNGGDDDNYDDDDSDNYENDDEDFGGGGRSDENIASDTPHHCIMIQT